MANKIGIGVSAELDTSAIEQKINALGQKIAQSNKMQYKPLSNSTVADLEKVVKQFEQLRKIQGDLNRRMNATGQGGTSVLDADWNKLYADVKSRNRQMLKAFEYATGYTFQPQPGSDNGPSPGPGGRGGGAGAAFAGMGVNAAQAGLRAAGPAGGVAAGALGTGMSAGFGAGLMGLLGGMLALGISKAVGSAMENVGKAEDNAVALDRLKRTIGDLGVSFNGLQEIVEGTSNNLRITYGEGGKLATQFAKQANLSTRQVMEIKDELETGVGMARAYGLDPSQGVGIMGQMRGMRVTTDSQESRRFALLIGETIGKSGAFAKAEEVMDAIAGYATSQARGTLGVGNVGGFTGMLSSMVGSGIPGLDPAGAGSLLMRVNAALAAGGGKGEASQFFTGRLGARRGMDVFDTQLWREGGAFSTADSTFHGDSAVARFYNKHGLYRPGGDETLLSANLSQLKRDYANDPKMMLQATANQLGLTMSQAAAFHIIDPNQMGGMESYAGDLTKLNATGIGNLSKTLYGTGADRVDVANSLAGRRGDQALKAEDLSRLDDAMKSGDEETQKQVLAQLIAQYGQERTQGADIRDSKNALDNIKTDIASKLIPLTLEMRHGIMSIAGVGGKTSSEKIMSKVIKADSELRLDGIDQKYQTLLAQKEKEFMEVRGDAFRTGDKDKFAESDRIADEMKELRKRHKEEIEEENKQTAAAIEQMKEAAKVRAEAIELERRKNEENKKILDGVGYDPSAPRYAGGSPAGGGGGGGGGRSASGRWMGNRGGGALPGSTSDAMQFFMDKGWSREQAAGIVANLVAESGLKHDIVGDGGSAYGVAQWHPDRQGDFARWAGKDIRESTRDEQYEFVHYEMTKGKEKPAGNRLKNAETAADSGSIVSRHYERPAARDAEAEKRAALASRIYGTKLPSDAKVQAQNQSQAVHVTFDSPEVRILGLDGKPAGPPAKLEPYVRTASPFGFNGYGGR